MHEHYERELCCANGPYFREAAGEICLFAFGKWLSDFATGSTAVSLAKGFV
jgi:hypothetical protein